MRKDTLEKLQKANVDNIERINYQKVSVQEFKERFEDKNLPCIIEGVVDEDWGYRKPIGHGR
jgi:DNA replicative helicase MCM subunit Mcm2 (Cdc46/Mcm family)